MRAFLRQLLTGDRRRFLAMLFLAALLVRVAFVLTRAEALHFPDSKTYDAIAQNLGTGRGLVLDEEWKVTRPPLYPILLAGCYAAFGHSFLAVRLIQAAAAACGCVLAFLLGEKLLDSVSGRIGSLIAAVYPFSVFFCGLILTETLFTAFLLLALWLLAGARKGGLRWAAGGGAAIGAGILLRSSLFLFPVFLMPFWLIWFGGGGRKAIKSFVAMVAAMGVVLSPWVVRNYRITNGHFVPTTLQVGRSLYEANSPQATGGPAMDLIDWEAEKEGRELSEVEDNRFFRDKALAYMKAHPGRTLRLTVVKLLRFWNIVPNEREYRTPGYVAISLVSYVPVMLFAVVGLIARRKDLSRCGLLLMPVLYFCLLHMVFVGSIRYRTPVMPFVILFSAGGIRSIVWPSDEDGKKSEETERTDEEKA